MATRKKAEEGVDTPQPRLGTRLLASRFVRILYDAGVDTSEVVESAAVSPPATAGGHPSSLASTDVGVSQDDIYAELIAELDGDNDALTVFKRAYQALSMISVEDERRAAALAMTAQQGHSLADVLKAIDSDRARLDVEVNDCLNEHLTAQRDRLAEVQQVIADCDREIRDREEKLTVLEQQRVILTREIEQYATRRAEGNQQVSLIERGMVAVGEHVARARDQITNELVRLRAKLTQK